MRQDRGTSDGRRPGGHGAHMSGAREAGGTSRRRPVAPLVALLAVLLVIAAAGGAYVAFGASAAAREEERQQETPVPENPEPTSDEQGLPANPIDFPALKAENPDIYAWISIPDTGVNYPILQSATDDNHYLKTDVDGNYSPYGAIFTQSMNATDFSDPVTLVYGHKTDNGTMFSDLHRFEDADFFASHEDMYIYVPGHVLTYRIIAAYTYDNRHIMNSFDFSDPEVLQRYFDSVLDPASMVVNVRAGATLGTDDRIVQLSTCVSSTSPDRYIVTGVLVNDQQTL